MDAAMALAGHPAAVACDRSSVAVAARDATLDPKLVAAAHSFEASLMEELLKPLQGGGEAGDQDENGGGTGAGLAGLGSEVDGSGGALLSFGSEALAGALAQRGGLGIARRILDHFEAVSQSAKAACGAMGETVPQGVAAGETAGRRRYRFQLGTKNRY